MWHDLAFRLLVAAPDAPSVDSSHDITVAVITVGGSVSLGLLTLIGTLYVSRRNTTAAVPTPPAVPLHSDAPHDDEDMLAARVRVLETFLWRNRLDPNRIATGEEVIDHVRIG